MRWLFCVIFVCCSCSKSLPAPYNTLDEVLPFDGQGWYSNRRAMERVLKSHDIKTVIEVGSWLGQSTRHIATVLPRDGKVYAVDHWLGSNEHQTNEKLPRLYQQFLSNVIHAKLTHKIIPVRMASLEAAKALEKVHPDLIYIDASHEKQAVYLDLCAWYPYVKERGYLCGDDWQYDGVREAVEQFACENALSIESQGAFWMLFPKTKF